MEMYRKYVLILLAIILLSACRGGTSKQEVLVAVDSVSDVSHISICDSLVEDAAEEQEEVVVVERIEISMNVEDYRRDPIPIPIFDEPEEPSYQTPQRYILAYIADSTLNSRVFVFYYSPRMKTNEYPFEQHLGSKHYNNYIGSIDGYSLKSGVSIPDTIESGAKLLFRAIGYEPYDVYIDSIGSSNLVEVKLTPKIYTSTVILKQNKGRITFDMVDEEPIDKTFYGDCRPIYSRDGNHADPLCAFSCMACCYPVIQKWQLEDAIRQSGKDIERLYKQLSKKVGRCSYLISYKDGRMVAEPEQLPGIKLDSLTSKLAQTNWRVDRDSHIVKLRMIFTTLENIRNAKNYFD